MKKIIAFLGEKENGKTTACNIFERLYEQNTEYQIFRVSVKQPIIDEIKRDLPETLKLLSVFYNLSIDDLFHRKPQFVRSIMQDYGQSKRREHGSYYWADKYALALGQIPDNSIILTDDIRFPEELEKVCAFKDNVVYNVIRLGKEQGLDKHPTERALDDYKSKFAKIEAGEGELEEVITKIFHEA